MTHFCQVSLYSSVFLVGYTMSFTVVDHLSKFGVAYTDFTMCATYGARVRPMMVLCGTLGPLMDYFLCGAFNVCQWPTRLQKDREFIVYSLCCQSLKLLCPIPSVITTPGSRGRMVIIHIYHNVKTPAGGASFMTTDKLNQFWIMSWIRCYIHFVGKWR